MDFVDEEALTDAPNFFDRKVKCNWHRAGDVVTYGRPQAGTDSLALVHIDGTPTLVTVTEVADAVYRVVRYRPRIGPTRGATDDGIDPIPIDMRDEANVKINAPLPTCCVCMNAPSNCFLYCRCTMPSTCQACAARLDACPQCREPIPRDLPRSPFGWGNIGGLYPLGSWGEMTLFIKTLTRRRITLQVRRNHRILEIKELVHDKECIPADQQRLHFAGYRLDDRLALSFYGVEKESTLDLILRLCGD
jgi:hypothetical protein